MSKESFLHQTQGILSIGYLYLIVMGILNETLFYSQVGVDILKYSSILDVLISPISRIAGSIGIIFFLCLVIGTVFLPGYISKYKDRSWFQKSFKLDSFKDEKEVEKGLFNTFLFMTALGIFGFFIGSGIGGGYDTAKDIKNNEIAYNDKLSLMTGEDLNVEIIGKNSSFLFYLTEESKTVKVSPISGVIKSIEEIKD